MKVITETELAMRAEHGIPTICRVCFDAKRVINLIGYNRNGKKEIHYGVCPECRQAIDSCPHCPKTR